jgi:DNA-binding transcriptional regulator WhiA
MEKINKEFIQKLYVDQLKSTYEIAKEMGVHRSTVCKALKKFDIKTRFQKKRDIVENRQLNDYQRNFLIGSLLGDGHITKCNNRTSSYKTSHSIKQKDYIHWIKDIFDDLGSNISKQVAYNKKYDKSYVFYNFSTLSVPELNYFRKTFYNASGKKIVPDSIDHIFTEKISLAVWFMEDGTYSLRNKSTYMCTDCFTRDEHVKLMKMLKNNFSLNANIVSYKNTHRLWLSSKETKKMQDIIRFYVIESMRYKLCNDFQIREPVGNTDFEKINAV